MVQNVTPVDWSLLWYPRQRTTGLRRARERRMGSDQQGVVQRRVIVAALTQRKTFTHTVVAGSDMGEVDCVD